MFAEDKLGLPHDLKWAIQSSDGTGGAVRSGLLIYFFIGDPLQFFRSYPVISISAERMGLKNAGAAKICH
jgi:hypothetical protein